MQQFLARTQYAKDREEGKVAHERALSEAEHNFHEELDTATEIYNEEMEATNKAAHQTIFTLLLDTQRQLEAVRKETDFTLRSEEVIVNEMIKECYEKAWSYSKDERA